MLDGVPTHILFPGAVLLALLLWFLIWFLFRGLFHWNRLRLIQSQIQRLPPSSQREDFRKIFAKDKRLSHLWKQYQNSLHVQTEDRDGQSVVVATRSTIPAEAYFNSQFVVDSRLTTEFFKHLPGIFTGIGIIGTFYGLIAGLRLFKVSENATTVRTSLESLMHSVGDAFLISASAIFLAMVVTFFEKVLLTALYHRTEEIAHAIDARFDAGAGEEYLARLVKSSEESASQSKILKDALVSELGALLRELTEAQLATSEKLHLQLAQRIEDAASKQVQATKEDNKAMADTIAESIKDSLKGPLEQIASTVQSASGDQSSAAIRMLNDVMVSFSQRLNDLFGGQINGINALNERTAQTMQDAVSALQALIGKLEEGGRKSTEDMAARMAAAIQSMEERQGSINDHTQAFIEQIKALVNSSQAETQQSLQSTLESVGQQMTNILGTLGQAQREALNSNIEREEKMGSRAQDIVSEMTGSVEAAVKEMTTASNVMAQSVSTLANATTTNIDKMNVGAERLNAAASAFATAGDRVTNVMSQAATVGTKLSELSGSLTASSGAVQEALRDYRAQREAVGHLLTEVRATVELARKEASLTEGVLRRIETSAEKLAVAQGAADEYLDGVSNVLGTSSDAFRNSVVSTLKEVNNTFHDQLTAAVRLLSTAIQDFQTTLDEFSPAPRGTR